MTPPLFLVDVLPDIGAGTVTLGGEEGRHAARVRRIGPAERVLLGDGRGTVLECSVAAVTPNGLALDITSRRAVPRPQPRLSVLQAIAKGERAELAVELLTEVGADSIVPWAAARSVARWDAARAQRAVARWRRTAREAAKQSRRAWLPEVAEPVAAAAAVDLVAMAERALVLHEQAQCPLTSVDDLPESGEVLVVVGPEGGIDDAELAAFVAVGARPVRLGPEVLRTSTAGTAAVSALAVRLGRW